MRYLVDYNRTIVPKAERGFNGSGPVKTYMLTPAELQHYRSLPGPRKYRDMDTTARQYLRAMR